MDYIEVYKLAEKTGDFSEAKKITNMWFTAAEKECAYFFARKQEYEAYERELDKLKELPLLRRTWEKLWLKEPIDPSRCVHRFHMLEDYYVALACKADIEKHDLRRIRNEFGF